MADEQPDNLEDQTRQFVLGTLDDEARTALEVRFLTDQAFTEEVLLAEDDLYQDYVDGLLDEETTRLFLERFASEPNHAERLAFARSLRAALTPAITTKEPQSSFLDRLRAFLSPPVLAAATFLIIVGVGLWWFFKPRSETEDVLAALSRVQRTGRFTDARLSDFPHAPRTEGKRSAGRDNADLAEARARALRALEKSKTADAFHAQGLVALAANDIDGAINWFTKAAEAKPTAASYRNDLAVTLLAKGGLENSARAAEELDQALRIDPENLVLYFNRAIAAEQLGATADAKRFWEKYLTRDSSSPWADEARERLAKLSVSAAPTQTKEQVLTSFSEHAARGELDEAWRVIAANRELNSGKLVSQQLAFLVISRTAAGDTNGAAEALRLMRICGELESSRAGDRFAADWAASLATLTTGKAKRLDEVIARQQTALELIKNGDYTKAAAIVRENELEFRAQDDPGNAELTRFVLGYLANRQTDFAKSNEILTSLLKTSTERKYRWLGIQTNIWLATNELMRRRYMDASRRMAEVATQSDQIDDLASQLRVRQLLAETSLSAGRVEVAFDALTKNLALSAPPAMRPRERWQTLDVAARLLMSRRLPVAGRALANEAMLIAEETKDPTFRFASLNLQARASSQLGEFATARELSGTALVTANSFGDENFRARALAISNLQRGEIEFEAGDFDAASQHFKQASDYTAKSDSLGAYKYVANAGLLRTLMSRGRLDEAREQLTVVIGLFDEFREAVRDERARNNFFDDEYEIYDLAIRLAMDSGDAAAAFDYSESARARSLLDSQAASANRLGNGPANLRAVTKPRSLGEIRNALPSDVQMIQYSVLPDRLIIWVIARDKFVSKTVTTDERELQSLISDLRDKVIANEFIPTENVATERLYSLLIAPVADELSPTRSLVIVPDKFLARLPFDLVGKERPLIDDFTITYAPSANSFLLASQTAAELARAGNTERIALIGDPAFSPGDGDKIKLRRLPSAVTEVEAIRTFYPKSEIAIGDAATRKRMTQLLGAADSLHFAGHFVNNESDPTQTGLILAGSNLADSTVAVDDLLEPVAQPRRLIVLSACETGDGRIFRGEGVTSAARAFLASGVAAVVASQWAVESEPTRDLMIDFHRFRQLERKPVAEALRLARLASRARGNPPVVWSAFITIGGQTSF